MTPNPGSQEAQDLGCKCPILDNGYGNEEVTGGEWAITKGCPVHPWEEMRQFKTGAVRDSEDNKPDFTETISWTAFNRYANYMTGKKKKYGQGNFKKGIPIDAYERSLLRHIDKYMRNKYEGGNDEPNEDHLSAMVFNIFGIIHEEEHDK